MNIKEALMKETEAVQKIKDRPDVLADHELWRCLVKATDGLWEAYLHLSAKERRERR